jgi:lipopolysaccharide transport system ATP-binding protein
MTDVVIRAENLSKKYRIRHQGERLRYVALRDVFAEKALAPWRWLNARRTGRHGEVGGVPVGAGSTKIEDFWALKDVSFEVKQGEVLGIIGRNGAGKSTLLKILSRITEPTTGRARIKGRVASLLEVGTGFHPELTGRENIFLNGAILGMSRLEIRRRFDEIVAFGEIEKFLDTPVKRYSSGMYVRLAFAVAAHLEPDILVVDEVLSVGDAAFQEKCLGKMNSVARVQGRTVLLVSHNMAAVQQLCQRAILVRSGSLAAEGEPAALVRMYMADTPAAGRVSLRDWKDRVTNGDATILDFETCDERGEPAGAVMFGGSIRFRITVEFHRPVSQPIFGVLVHTADGEAMLSLQSSHNGLRLGRPDGRIVLEAAVEGIGLYPGEYSLSPWVADSRKSDIDYARHCCTIRVLPAPGVHGDLKLDPDWGKYWIPSSWSVLDSCETGFMAAASEAATIA